MESVSPRSVNASMWTMRTRTTLHSVDASGNRFRFLHRRALGAAGRHRRGAAEALGPHRDRRPERDPLLRRPPRGAALRRGAPPAPAQARVRRGRGLRVAAARARGGGRGASPPNPSTALANARGAAARRRAARAARARADGVARAIAPKRAARSRADPRALEVDAPRTSTRPRSYLGVRTKAAFALPRPLRPALSAPLAFDGPRGASCPCRRRRDAACNAHGRPWARRGSRSRTYLRRTRVSPL